MKQTIKLKESQLRRLIRESIMNILSEEQLNELDPRTYASYAQKRTEQANGERALSTSQQRRGLNQQQIQQQAAQGRIAAVDAWNNQYGYNVGTDRDEGTYTRMGDMKRGGGEISDRYDIFTNNAQYDPRHDVTYLSTGKGYKGGIGDRGQKVAQQMANGTGRYDKQTGKWS